MFRIILYFVDRASRYYSCY